MSAFRVDVRKRVKAALQRPKVRTEVRPYGLHTISTRLMHRTAPRRARGDRVHSSQKSAAGDAAEARRRIFLPEARVLVPVDCVVACHRLVFARGRVRALINCRKTHHR